MSTSCTHADLCHLATAPFKHPQEVLDFLNQKNYRCIGRGFSSKIFEVNNRVVRVFFKTVRSDFMELKWLNYCEKNAKNDFLMNVQWVRKFSNWHIAEIEKLTKLTPRWYDLIRKTPFFSFGELEFIYPQASNIEEICHLLDRESPYKEMALQPIEEICLMELWDSLLEAWTFLAEKNLGMMDIKMDSFMLKANGIPVLIDPLQENVFGVHDECLIQPE